MKFLFLASVIIIIWSRHSKPDCKSASKQKASSHFRNSYCKAASLLKPYLTCCLAADLDYFPLPKKTSKCYVKRQLRVCVACDPRNMQFLLVWKAPRQALLRRLCVCRDLIRTHRDSMDINTEQGRNDRHLSSDTLSVQWEKKMFHADSRRW